MLKWSQTRAGYSFRGNYYSRRSRPWKSGSAHCHSAGPRSETKFMSSASSEPLLFQLLPFLRILPLWHICERTNPLVAEPAGPACLPAATREVSRGSQQLKGTRRRHTSTGSDVDHQRKSGRTLSSKFFFYTFQAQTRKNHSAGRRAASCYLASFL